MASRKEQAIQTRKKIFETAIALMQNNGFENTSIDDICEAAEVSVGCFYHHFKSKNDVLIASYDSVDKYFADVVKPELESLEIKEQLFLFFIHLARHNEEQGVDFAKRRFSSNFYKRINVHDRTGHTMLRDIIRKGQEEGIITTEMGVEEIENLLFIIFRGFLNDWCTHNGEHSLEEKIGRYFEKIITLVHA